MEDKLKKIELDSILSYEYLCDNLKELNDLSSKLIEILDFHSGQFFTFLSNDINRNQIYEFKQGGIASEARQKTLDLVFEILKNHPEVSAIFDECFATYNKESKDPLLFNYGFHYLNEIYYIADKNVSKKELKTCFHVSNAIWHSLCVISKIRFDKENRELSNGQIKEICLNAQLIIIGAYDAESYVFWKRNDFFY